MLKRRWSIVIGLILLSRSALAGEVETRAGKKLSGAVSLSPEGVVVTVGGSSATVPFAEIVYASVDVPGTTTQPANPSNAGELPGGWTSNDVGPVKEKGSVTFADGTFTVSGSGWGLWSGVDSCHFAYRMLEGDGQIIAHVRPRPGNVVPMTAGVMIRASIDPQTNFAGSILEVTGQVRLKSRPRPEQETPLNYTVQAGEAGWMVPKNPSGWVRLTRAGKSVTAYQSNDGRFWERLGAKDVELPSQAMIGLAVATSGNSIAAPTHFDSVRVIPGSPDLVALHPSPAPAKGVILTDGSGLPGAVTEITRSTITLRSADGKESTQPAAQLAWAIFKPAPGDLAAVIPPRAQGVLLTSGDFFEGEVAGLSAGKVTVHSILLGPRSFDVASEVLALVLNSPANWDGVKVKLRSEKILAGASLGMADGKVTLAGQTIEGSEIAEIFGPATKP